MSKLSLYFYNKNNPELVRTEFVADGSAERLVSVRGQHAVEGGSTFQWTSAVQALSVFLLRSASSRSQPFILRGSRGSLASSLDFALSKEPNWLVEMFGVCSSGRALLRRIIKRTNAEQKFAGPVSLLLNPEYLNLSDLRIFLDGAELSAGNEIWQLAQKIETTWIPRNKHFQKCNLLSQAALLPESTMPSSFRYLLSQVVYRETLEMLQATEIFSSSALRRRVNQISAHPSFVRIWSKGLALVDPIGFRGGRRLPLAADVRTRIDARLSQGTPLRVAVPSTLPASIALFQYLKFERGYQLEIDYSYVHAIELVKKILSDSLAPPPDVCVLGIAPAGTLLASRRSREYSPLMLMPMMSHRVVASKEATYSKRPSSRRYLFIQDDPSTASFYFDDMVRAGIISKEKVSIRHQEPDQVFTELKNGDGSERAVLFFPHYDLNCAFNSCALVDRPLGAANFKESILFVHHAVERDCQRVNDLRLAIYDAWNHLLYNRASLQSTVNRLADDDRYAHFVSRSSGLVQVALPA